MNDTWRYGIEGVIVTVLTVEIPDDRHVAVGDGRGDSNGINGRDPG